MKAKLIPVYYESAQHPDFVKQLGNIKQLLAEEAEILEPLPVGAVLPEADAVVFPQMLGQAYRMADTIRAIGLPRLVITSEFGTMSMWDWEIDRYLRAQGIGMITPYSLEQTRVLCRALALKRELRQARLLTYQDYPGQKGFQDEIFRRFYWWEDECTARMEEQFGVELVKKSFKILGERAKSIPDAAAEAAWAEWQDRAPVEGLSQRAILSALKIYLAVKHDLDADPRVQAVGINCLNESHHSDTTPCLAWNLLFEERQMMWGCEADTMSMLTKLLVYRTLGVPVMMSNLYPFLMGQAAVKHERIADFPPVPSEPENHVLIAHCGYLGVLPRAFSTEWTLRKKVLAIVDENASAIDARLPIGDITLVKLEPDFRSISIIEGQLTGYAQFPGSDCVNGAILKVPNGHALMEQVSSHHYILSVGRNAVDLKNVAKVFGLEVKVI
ncbi:MAG: hypothetical protein IH586_14625 [Anaerolineaceae bacterium]|nr:hypothetical protein [Anaerolineaceae bacterium]